MNEKEFKPIRLTKKSLLEFLDSYEDKLEKPFEGTDEEKLAGFKTEWEATNNFLKSAGKKKSFRRGKKYMLKCKWGLKKNYKSQATSVKLKLVKQIKRQFGLI